MPQQKLILDVDTGIDDAMALLYALASPDAELLVATCAPGNVNLEAVVRNTRGVLDVAGASHIDVIAGARTPLVKALVTTPETHGPTGLGYAVLPAPSRALSTPSPDGMNAAAARIVAEVRRHPGAVTIIGCAPATNIAAAFRLDPELPTLLHDVVLMTGAISTPGNTGARSEWNAWCDPEALDEVIRACAAAGRPALILPLDATESALIRPPHWAALVAAAGRAGAQRGDATLNPVLRLIDEALRFYDEFHLQYDKIEGSHIHDAFTVAVAL
ncbi:MAG: nucleoside hydrolase, partial [Chloroflexi bacterium]|nr:nucleoside hydrolase [Chloroflexota bacterium]